MLYLLTLQEEYEAATILGVFDKEHIKQAVKDAYRSHAVYDHFDKCSSLECGHLYVTLIKSNELHTVSSNLREIRAA